MPKGPFIYYVSKEGGWGWPNAYFCLHGGWVGQDKCLRKQNLNSIYLNILYLRSVDKSEKLQKIAVKLICISFPYTEKKYCSGAT